MINGPLALQTLAFFCYLHYYFMLQVVLCRALGHYLAAKPIQRPSIKPQKAQTSSHGFTP